MSSFCSITSDWKDLFTTHRSAYSVFFVVVRMYVHERSKQKGKLFIQPWFLIITLYKVCTVHCTVSGLLFCTLFDVQLVRIHCAGGFWD
jgi:hypothetical protein